MEKRRGAGTASSNSDLLLLLLLLLYATAAASAAAAAAAAIVTPEAHGATGDGKADDSTPCQAAVDACAARPGPCVVLFARAYLSGPLVVNGSDVTLHVAGALYMLPKRSFDVSRGLPFLSNAGAGSLRNLRLTGGGVLGNPSPAATLAWWACKLTGCFRPHLVVFSDAVGVRIDGGLTFQNAPNHNIEVSNCTGVRVDGIRVQAPLASPNTDGLNFYGGSDQSFTNSVVHNGDDCVSVVPIGEGAAVCAAEPSDRPECRGGNVVVRNVSCVGGHGIAIGGVRHGTVSNVTFSNMTARGGAGNTQGLYSPGGLRIKSYPNSTGSVYDVLYEDIVLDGVYTPLSVLSHYCPWPCNTPDGNHSCRFHDITFRNVRGGGRQAVQGVFVCSPLAPCANVTLENVVLHQDGDPSKPGSFQCAHAEITVDSASSPGGCPKRKKRRTHTLTQHDVN